ncbi:MAG TPA: hypothetical protein VHW73_11395 [Rudaea sp.]|jgi:hypothetical protein|nr:hypothetical protein [Rudaea sp.]
MNTIACSGAIALFFVSASSAACSVTGTAYTLRGKPLQGAVVRLVDLDSQTQTFALTDTSANYSIDASNISGQRVRVDLISDATVVTGTHLPTRSIVGESDVFACSAGSAHQDVHIQVD